MKVLLACGSRGGVTVEIADAMAEEIRASGIGVDVQEACDVKDVEPYDAVLLGSSVWAGQLHPGLLHMVRQHEKALVARPVGMFVVCLSLASDDPDVRQRGEHYLDRMEMDFPTIVPIMRGAFAGAVLPHASKQVHSSLFERLVLFFVRRKMATDERNWDEIRAFARDFTGKLT